MALAHRASDAAERRRLAPLGQGIVVAPIGASLVFACGHQEQVADDTTETQ